MLKDIFINSVIIISFISIRYNLFRASRFKIKSRFLANVLNGVFYGLIGIILMLFSLNPFPNVLIDFRNIAIIFSSIYGGIISTVITSIIIAMCRILYFGISNNSIISFFSIILSGLICGLITRYTKNLKRKWVYCVVLTLINGSLAISLLINNLTKSIQILTYLWVGTIFVCFVTYPYIKLLEYNNVQFKKFREESQKDYLTGLNNVRSFNSFFNKLKTNVNKSSESVCLLLIDIDFFKRVNDTYGHKAGDMVLKQFAHILKMSCRSYDIISRNGGEEFSVILANCRIQQAAKIAEQIRSTIERSAFVINENKKIHITVSLGVAGYPETLKDMNSLMEKADMALYKAKCSGRNKVVAFYGTSNGKCINM